MSEVLSLLIDSIVNSDRAFLWCLLDVAAIVMLPFFLEGGGYGDGRSVANIIVPILILLVMILPPIYFAYYSSEYRQKAAKLCDQIPDCNFEVMHDKAKKHVLLN